MAEFIRFTVEERQLRPHVSIVIVTHNEWKYTNMCLSSLRRFTTVPYEVIAVDNGSTDHTLKALRERKKHWHALRLLENSINRGFAAGMNQGIQRAEGDFLVLLNNDTLPSHRWLDSPLKLLQSRNRAGIVGPVSNRVIRQQKIHTHLRSLADVHRFCRQYNRTNPRRWRQTRLLSGFCMVLPYKLVEKIGLLDERFGMGTYEDDDFCIRAQKNGYTCWIAGDTYVHHFGNRSFKRDGYEEFRKILRQNRQYYIYKWGRKPING